MWPRRVCWLSAQTGVRQARRWRVRAPSSTAANAVAEHPRERSGEPVHRASRRAAGGGRARDAGPSMYPRTGADNRSPSAPVGGHGHRFRRGMDQPELRVFSRVSPRLLLLLFHPSVTRRAASYGLDPQSVSRPGGTKPAGAHPRLSQSPLGRDLPRGPNRRHPAKRGRHGSICTAAPASPCPER